MSSKYTYWKLGSKLFFVIILSTISFITIPNTIKSSFDLYRKKSSYYSTFFYVENIITMGEDGNGAYEVYGKVKGKENIMILTNGYDVFDYHSRQDVERKYEIVKDSFLSEREILNVFYCSEMLPVFFKIDEKKALWEYIKFNLFMKVLYFIFIFTLLFYSFYSLFKNIKKIRATFKNRYKKNFKKYKR